MAEDTLAEMIRYDPDTGHLWWKVGGGRRHMDRPAGTVNPNGYVQVQINKVLYKAHRLAWFLYHGAWPDGEIDHINRVRDDNRIENLRVVDRMDNAANNGASHVRYDPDNFGKPWVVQIRRRGKSIRKAFATEEDALKFPKERK